MKRRALSFALALVLLLCLVPVNAFAASNRTTSDAGVSLIKFFEGFSERAYWDNSQWTVGYGTRCPDDMVDEYQSRDITEAEAVALLEKELASFEKSINQFDDNYGLNLTQYEFDALISFTYNVGASWTRSTDQVFTQAVINGDSGNDFLFAITMWSMSGGKLSEGHIKRRQIEANLYLNGVYSTSVPANYSYVTFDHITSVYNGETRTIRVQGYDTALTDTIRPAGYRSGYRFLGWYTASTGGQWITDLDSTTAKKVLYAHWQSGEGNVASDGTILGTAASYDRTAAGTINVYTDPATSSDCIYTIASGTAVSIVADYVDADGVKWGNLVDGGWIQLTDTTADVVASETPEPETVIATGTVTASGSLNVRAGAGTGYAKVGSLTKGTKVEIYEIVTVNGTEWGRISNGWISLDYVALDEVQVEDPTVPEEPEEETTVPEEPEEETTVPEEPEEETTAPTEPEEETTAPTEPEEETTAPTEPEEETTAPTEPEEEPEEETAKVVATGTVNTSSGKLNVRAGAGSSYAKVGSLAKGTKVEIYEIVTVNGTEWGRISNGWISLAYVKLDSTTTEQTVQTGVVNTTSGSLNVRSGAGTNYAVVASLKKGTTVKIYETKTVGSVTWGRVDQGWVSMKYIKLAGTSTDTGSNGGTTDDDEDNTTVTAAARTGKVTASGSLNVRSGAGTSYSKVGTLSSGAKVTVTELKMVSGSAWGKTSKGWICLDYVKLDMATAGAPALIKGSNLNIRSGAGTSYSKVGTYNKGDVVTILETKTVRGTTWGKTSKGWISMDYVI